MEKIVKPVSGFLALLLALLSLGFGIYAADENTRKETYGFFCGILLLVFSIFMFKGIMIINPNHSRVLVFFGKYVGSVKDNGLLWVNPLYSYFQDIIEVPKPGRQPIESK